MNAFWQLCIFVDLVLSPKAIDGEAIGIIVAGKRREL
jgi:hypothetical protein